MRWVVFLTAAAVALVFDTGASEILRLGRLWDVRPALCAALAAFVALSAPRAAALWACLTLGLLLDLCNPLTAGDGSLVYLPGPYALGLTAGGWTVLRLRAMVFRRRSLTIGVMTLLCALVLQAVVAGICLLRAASWYPGGALHWTDLAAPAELLRRALIAVYSGLVAIPVGWLLLRTLPLWGFERMTAAAYSHRHSGR